MGFWVPFSVDIDWNFILVKRSSKSDLCVGSYERLKLAAVVNTRVVLYQVHYHILTLQAHHAAVNTRVVLYQVRYHILTLQAHHAVVNTRVVLYQVRYHILTLQAHHAAVNTRVVLYQVHYHILTLARAGSPSIRKTKKSARIGNFQTLSRPWRSHF